MMATRNAPRRLFRSGHAYGEIQALLSSVEPKGRCLDLLCGKGVNIRGIRNAGFEPVAGDLYPEQAMALCSETHKVDFLKPLPFEDNHFAAVLCSEGIEHCARQLDLLREFSRILRPGGALLITTPNVLNLRARISYLLNGHYWFARAPVSEATQVWYEPAGGDLYIGHVFCVSYFALRFMLRVAGFERIAVTTAKYSTTALLLAPALWLPVRIATARLLRRQLRPKDPELHREMTSHVMSAALLFGKKLIVLARKPTH